MRPADGRPGEPPRRGGAQHDIAEVGMLGVVVVGGVPPHRLDERRDLDRAGHRAHADAVGDEVHEPALHERDPARTRDEDRDGEEVLRDDLDARLDAEHAQLQRRGGGRRRAVEGRHPRQLGQLLDGELVADLVVVLGHQAQPLVAVQVPVPQLAEEPVRQDEQVRAEEHLRGAIHDVGRRRREAQARPRRLLRHGRRDEVPEHRDAVVADDQRELPGGGRRVELRLGGEDPLRTVSAMCVRSLSCTARGVSR